VRERERKVEKTMTRETEREKREREREREGEREPQQKMDRSNWPTHRASNNIPFPSHEEVNEGRVTFINIQKGDSKLDGGGGEGKKDSIPSMDLSLGPVAILPCS
jgi:hypothetical protein